MQLDIQSLLSNIYIWYKETVWRVKQKKLLGHHCTLSWRLLVIDVFKFGVLDVRCSSIQPSRMSYDAWTGTRILVCGAIHMWTRIVLTNTVNTIAHIDQDVPSVVDVIQTHSGC